MLSTEPQLRIAMVLPVTLSLSVKSLSATLWNQPFSLFSVLLTLCCIQLNFMVQSHNPFLKKFPYFPLHITLLEKKKKSQTYLDPILTILYQNPPKWFRMDVSMKICQLTWFWFSCIVEVGPMAWNDIHMNVSLALKINVYFATVRQSILSVSLRSRWMFMFFR